LGFPGSRPPSQEGAQNGGILQQPEHTGLSNTRHQMMRWGAKRTVRVQVLSSDTFFGRALADDDDDDESLREQQCHFMEVLVGVDGVDKIRNFVFAMLKSLISSQEPSSTSSA
jgi:hypothetical protein